MSVATDVLAVVVEVVVERCDEDEEVEVAVDVVPERRCCHHSRTVYTITRSIAMMPRVTKMTKFQPDSPSVVEAEDVDVAPTAFTNRAMHTNRCVVAQAPIVN